MPRTFTSMRCTTALAQQTVHHLQSPEIKEDLRGDCCMYAVASVADEPLLCAGDDLARAELLLACLDTDEVPADLRQADEPGPFCE